MRAYRTHSVLRFLDYFLGWSGSPPQATGTSVLARFLSAGDFYA
jgi:hypothetical protein